MFILSGRYNIARVFLPDESYLDEETKKQIQTFLNHPCFRGNPICIMPDCHAGKGAVIGFTFNMKDYVIPNIVGVDIGCGVASYNLGKLSEIDFRELDDYIRRVIPIGFNVHVKRNDEQLTHDVGKINNLLLKYLEESVYIIDPQLTGLKHYRESLGTLGGGNHFIELGKDEENNYWITVHSGSRQFGLSVANFYQNKAKELAKLFFLGDEYKELEFLPMDYWGQSYLDQMYTAQDYANVNRFIMLDKIVSGYFHQDIFDFEKWVSSSHNYISQDDNIIRKGAIRADKDDPVIIPFNMEDGLIIGVGKGNRDWNLSAPHGAGRIMSRKKAKELLSLDDAKKSMQEKEIFSTSLNNSTLDEVKGAYKDKDLIIKMIKDTVEIKHFVKPVYNLKAGE